MSQEYTEDKDVTLKPLTGGKRLIEAILIIVAVFAIYLMASIVSFDPSDPSWSQTAWHEPIHNLGGSFGAWMADTFLFTFGVLAYALPVILVVLCWVIFRERKGAERADFFTLALRIIGALTLVITSCGLAAFNVDDIYYFASGGVIGSLINSAMQPWFNNVGATLFLLCTWSAGLTLFTGWSWLTVAEKIGGIVLGAIEFVLYGPQRKRHRLDQETEENQVDNESETEGEPVSGVLNDDPLFTSTSTQSIDVHSLESAFSAEKKQADTAFDTALLENSQFDASTTQLNEQSGESPSNFFEENPVEPAKESESRHLFYSAQTEEPRIDSTSENWLPLDELTPFTSSRSVPETHQDEPAKAAQIVFTPAHSFNNGVQVKQGIGPELPRPNRVKLPTKRELASYGIKLPSQRMAELQTKQEIQPKEPYMSHEAVAPFANQQTEYADQTDEEKTQELRLGQAFAMQQQTRYQEQDFSTDEQNDFLDDEDQQLNDEAEAWEQEQLREAFMAQQQARYSTNHSDFLDESREPVQHEPIDQRYDYQSLNPQATQTDSKLEGLIHPFLMRDDRSMPKPTTPLPTLDLLASPPREEEPVDINELEQTARLIEDRLADYRVKADVVGISPGPVVTRFELELAPGVKAARISNLSRDLARSLSTVAVRIVEVIPGKPYVGLELPNRSRQTVHLREVIDCKQFRETESPLAIVLGKDIAGQPVVADLAKMPHLLVAGTTGSGKSVGVNAMIISILYKATPEDVKFIMIDPKMLELSVYEGIPHLLTEVVTDMKDAANALRWCVNEMERRYKLMSALGVRNIAGYNERVVAAERMGRPIPDPFWKPSDSMDIQPPVLEKLPYIVVMVDEFADLIMTVGKKIEELIARLAQKARAAGIHLVLATQRPSVDVITGLIKANIPTRIAFTVSSKIDSRTILDQAGAESLLGMGDMLYLPPNSSMPIRVHGAFVRDQEVHAVVQDWKARGRPRYIDGIVAGDGDDGDSSTSNFDNTDDLDPLFDEVVVFVVDKRRASVSGVQRQFRTGYNRAARIIEQLEAHGIVSAPGHNGNREVLAPPRNE